MDYVFTPIKLKTWSYWLFLFENMWKLSTSGSRAAAKSKMERFVILVNGFQPLTIIIKRSILDVAAALDPLLTKYPELESNAKLFNIESVEFFESIVLFQKNGSKRGILN